MSYSVGNKAKSITKKHTQRVEILREDLDHAATLRRSQREHIWKRNERQWGGNIWETADDPTSDLVNINVSFSTANTILPHITGRDPVFMVEPLSADSTPKNARIQEAFLNRKWRDRRLGAQRALRAAAWDYVVHGDGFLKTTYQLVKQATEGIDDPADVVEEYVDRVKPWDIWIDPVSDEGIEKARWVANRIWMTEDEARADASLTIPSTYAFTAREATSHDDGSSQTDKTSPKRLWVEMIEFYDVSMKAMYVVPRDGDPRPWKVVEGITLPIEQIGNHHIPHSPWHMGDLEQTYDVQRELDKTRSQMITHRKRDVAKVLIREDALTEEGKAALTSSVVGEFVPVKGQDMSLSELAQPIQMAPLSESAYATSQQSEDDMYSISGISDMQRGASPDITRTATEAQIMQGSSNVKLDAKLNTIEQAVRNIGEYMLAIARDVYPATDVDEMAMFIGGVDAREINERQAGEDIIQAQASDDPAKAEAIAATSSLYGETIITPNEEVFAGTYQVLVEHSSTDALNPQRKADKYRRALEFLSTLAPALAQSGIKVDLGRMARLWLEAEGIPGTDAILSGSAPLAGGPQGVDGSIGAGPPQGMGMAPGQPQIPGGSGVPPELMAGLEQMLSGAPQEPVTPANSGALDPANYPNVGV